MQTITPAQLKAALAAGPVTLVDVREQDEWDAGHIDGAHHIRLAELPGRLAEIDAEADIVCYCRVGGRSAHACQLLEAAGFGRVSNLQGGILAYERD